MMASLASMLWTVVNWIAAHPVGCIFGVIALVSSGLFGWCATDIWVQPEPEETKKELTNRQKKAQRAYQVWFNFTGSLVGWIILWVLICRYWPYFSDGSAICLSWWDFLGAFIAFVGITGHLPWTVHGIVSSLYLIAIKAAGRVVN